MDVVVVVLVVMTIWGLFTLRFVRATWPLLKINIRHGRYRHEYNRPGMDHSLNSTCDIRPLYNRHKY